NGNGVQGVPSISASATSLSFPSERLGVSSAPQSVTLTNNGTATLTISGITITGTDASSFTLNAPGLPTTVAVNGTYSFSVVFTPETSFGNPLTAQANVANDSATNPLVIQLSGFRLIPPTPHPPPPVPKGQILVRLPVIEKIDRPVLQPTPTPEPPPFAEGGGETQKPFITPEERPAPAPERPDTPQEHPQEEPPKE
ncbi:MAG: choice-of-anchor D domain-containing protein, partial [Silvibacterium sp.]|nr:choice-of-anchor D domain-containing protein [Silvibacterium sp.]